ncbi:MAG: RnfABCDGE type electron transport complex subunit B [Ruminococcaceae bacterium]|nr:RnfABCDGE type electron transport complex subunit B [Oscillospiraceae bacterium]
MAIFLSILKAILVLGTMGAVFGALLAVAANFFSVKQDKRLPLVQEALPGVNCGGCGYTGCAAYAKAIVNDGAKTNLCPVGGVKVAKAVAEIMGVEAENVEKKRAVVMCSGNNSVASTKYEYLGADDCASVSKLGGGIMECQYGCVGLGSCVKKCPVNAIELKDNLAVVDCNKCIGCGICVDACPKHLIKLVPFDSATRVACSSKDKGADVRQVCEIGCIGCGICAKNCPSDAIEVSDNLAKINPEKCTGCGICEEKCPKKVIVKK